jgi:hydrophobe/amphiphile efflux-3 (HAE3) family protein
MLDRFLAAFADFVTTNRRAVLIVVALLAVVCGAALPRLQTESSPENLIISFGGYAEQVERFRESFGDTDNVMVLLVEAEDATTREALAYQHRLARHMAGEAEVLRVDGLTVSPIPRGPDPGAGADDVGTLDDLDALDAELAAPPDEEVERALETLVESARERFPLGLQSLAERATEADRAPIVEGDEVTDAHAAAIRRAIEESPLVVGRLVSADRTLAAVVVSLRAEIGTGSERVAFVQRIDGWLDENAPPDGIALHRAGLPHLRTAIVAHMMRDQLVLVPLTALVCIVLLYLSFRWIPGTVLPLVVVGLSVLGTVGGMAIVGEPMTILTNVVPTLLMIIALADSVHIISRWEEELRGPSKPDPTAAAARALRTMAVACFLTSITTAVGLGSLLVSHTQMLRHFGGVAGIGTMLAYVVTILVIPASLPFFKPPASLGDVSERPAAEAGRIERITVAGTQVLLAHPWKVLAGCVLLFVPTVWMTSYIQVDTSLRDTFEQSDPVVVAMHRMDERMDGIRPLEVMIQAEDEGRLADPDVAAAVVAFEEWADAQEGILRSTSYTDYLHETWARLAGLGRNEDGSRDGTDPRAFPLETRERIDALRVLLSRVTPDPSALYLTRDGRRAHIELRVGDIGARRSSALIEAVQAEAERRFVPLGLEVSITGEAYIGSRGIEAVVSDLLSSLLLSSILIFLMLVVLFRSFRYAVLSVPPNVFPLACATAWMVIRGIPLNAGTAVVFSLAVGVGVDGTIHTIARLLEEQSLGLDRDAAILRMARGTGRAIVISAASLMLGFGVLTFSSFIPVRAFGELVAVAMGASLFATLVLQPVLVRLFGGTVRPRGGPPRTAPTHDAAPGA